MGNVTLGQILTAVETTLSAAPTLERSMKYDELTEGINDTPLLQVYPESGTQDPSSNGTERTTFRAGIRQTSITINCDYYAQQRKHIGEDMGALVDGVDAIVTILEQQNAKPYFGLDAIKAFNWTWNRVVFEYGDPGIKYAGVRFSLDVRIF